MILTIFGWLVALLIVVSALVIFANWRITLPLLVLAEGGRIMLVQQTMTLNSADRTALLAAEVATAVGVSVILFITAFTFNRDYNAEQLDEFGLFELRRAARRAQQQRTQLVGRGAAYVVPIGGVVLAGLATWLLSQAYPIARNQIVDAAWIFTLLSALLTLVTANDVLKLGLGLLLLMSSTKLLYFGVTSRLDVLHVALLELLSLVLAIIVAYLSGVLYGRLRTLEVDSLLERR